jgi:hypothetical protein
MVARQRGDPLHEIESGVDDDTPAEHHTQDAAQRQVVGEGVAIEVDEIGK